jgi:Xaa-Pro aminopeptidase
MVPGSETPSEVFERRREAALLKLGDGVMVLPAAPVQHRSRDTERPYVPDRELYYLSGATEAGAVAVLVGGPEPRFVLFVADRDTEAELWNGPLLGPERAAEALGPDACHGLAELRERLPDLLQSGDRIYYRLGHGGLVEELVLGALARGRARGSRTGTGPRGIVDPGEILDDLRLVKDDLEVERLRRAAAISVVGHLAGAAAIRPGAGEWLVEAAVDGAFRSAGARGPGFETIVGTGANACVLHYVANSATIAEGDLVLVDAGAEAALYHGDMTRTYPASGRFSAPQRSVYDLVERARLAAVEAVRPGATIADVHGAAVAVLAAGLVDLGALDGSADDAVESGAVKRFFPHQTSHWLGLDVHDPGDYARAGRSRTLEPGMVFTIEPGLYFGRGAAEDGAAPYRGIGVRIEDDVLVTPDGCEVLGVGLPTAAADVEALVALHA